MTRLLFSGPTPPIAFMNFRIGALIVLLLVTSCDSPPHGKVVDSDSEVRTDEKNWRQKAIAGEIVAIQDAAVDALLHLSDSNVASFVARFESLSDRLEKISKELDKVGSFPPGLREATLREVKDHENAMAKRGKNRGPLQPGNAKIIEPACERYLGSFVSVMNKAGLVIEAGGGSPAATP